MRFCLALLFFLSPISLAYGACTGRLVSEGVYNAPVCVPADAQRIVVLDPLLTLGLLIEMKVPVIGTPYMGIQDAEMIAFVKQSKMVDLGNPKEPSLERVAALKPDLIIGSTGVHSPVYAAASQIAPTVLVDHMDWKKQLQLLAEMTGRTGAVQKPLDDYHKRVASIRERMRDVTVSAVRFAPGAFVVFLDGPAAYAPYAVLREAGVKRSAYETVTDDTIVKRPDWEELAALDGDILLYVVSSGFESAPDDALEKQVIENPFWQMLPAVQAGHAFRIDRGTWMGFHGIASANRVLDDIERYILADR